MIPQKKVPASSPSSSHFTINMFVKRKNDIIHAEGQTEGRPCLVITDTVASSELWLCGWRGRWRW
jgi:hypothetical protein